MTHPAQIYSATIISERDIENVFLENGFYDALSFEGTGTDLRNEFTLPDDRRSDYITLDTNEAVIAVYEFKTTGRDLPSYEDQLFHCTVSKNPFNACAVRRFHHDPIKVQVSLILSNLSKIETLNVQDTEGRGFIHNRMRTSQQRAQVLG